MKKRWMTGYLFIMPGFIGILVFIIMPYMDVVRRAFVQTAAGRFIGMNNFIEVFQNKAFGLAMGNTVRFVAVCIPILLALSLGIAVLLTKNSQVSKVIKTGVLIPMAIPVASVVLLWQFLFHGNGFLNGFLRSEEHTSELQSPR